MLILGGGALERDRAGPDRQLRRTFRRAGRTSFRRAHHFRSACIPIMPAIWGLAANPKLVARVKASDLVIAAGARLNELTSPGLHPVRHSRRRR